MKRFLMLMYGLLATPLEFAFCYDHYLAGYKAPKRVFENIVFNHGIMEDDSTPSDSSYGYQSYTKGGKAGCIIFFILLVVGIGLLAAFCRKA